MAISLYSNIFGSLKHGGRLRKKPARQLFHPFPPKDCFLKSTHTPENKTWVFPKIGVPQNGWFIMENPIKMGWFGGTIIFGNTHMSPKKGGHHSKRNGSSSNHGHLTGAPVHRDVGPPNRHNDPKGRVPAVFPHHSLPGEILQPVLKLNQFQSLGALKGPQNKLCNDKLYKSRVLSQMNQVITHLLLFFHQTPRVSYKKSQFVPQKKILQKSPKDPKGPKGQSSWTLGFFWMQPSPEDGKRPGRSSGNRWWGRHWYIQPSQAWNPGSNPWGFLWRKKNTTLKLSYN